MMFDQQQLNHLFRYCLQLSQQHSDAYDLLQSSVESYLVKPPKKSESKMAYIKTIIRRNRIDEIRRARKLYALDDVASIGLVSEMDVLAEIIIKDELEYFWQSLEAIDQTILTLWAVDDMTTLELASELGLAHGTVLSRIHRLRKKALSQKGALIASTKVIL